MMINNQILIRTQVKMSGNSTYNKFSAVVTYDSSESADNAIKNSPIMINDLEIKPTYAKPEQKLRPFISPKRLYVTGFPPTCPIEEIQKMMGECQISVPPKSGKEKEGSTDRRPFIFVTYNTEKEKDEAVNKLNGKKMGEEYTLKLLPALSNTRTSADRIKGKTTH
ncbi:hypothetical protein H311_02752 [Anncaliia algerae PRA109]|nr:hypothetical protein H311_02875 [Anncaliia algerae PRA109]KCZ76254.1 hypothetical protein H311_02752 [Anncaliia algerae PRA109]